MAWKTLAGVQHLTAQQQWVEERDGLRQSLLEAQAASQQCCREATQTAQLREDKVSVPQLLVCVFHCVMLVYVSTSMR